MSVGVATWQSCVLESSSGDDAYSPYLMNLVRGQQEEGSSYRHRQNWHGFYDAKAKAFYSYQTRHPGRLRLLAKDENTPTEKTRVDPQYAVRWSSTVSIHHCARRLILLRELRRTNRHQNTVTAIQRSNFLGRSCAMTRTALLHWHARRTSTMPVIS